VRTSFPKPGGQMREYARHNRSIGNGHAVGERDVRCRMLEGGLLRIRVSQLALSLRRGCVACARELADDSKVKREFDWAALTRKLRN
jgi:hypothetical protein